MVRNWASFLGGNEPGRSCGTLLEKFNRHVWVAEEGESSNTVVEKPGENLTGSVRIGWMNFSSLTASQQHAGLAESRCSCGCSGEPAGVAEISAGRGDCPFKDGQRPSIPLEPIG